jgi:hypothetical protein
MQQRRLRPSDLSVGLPGIPLRIEYAKFVHLSRYAENVLHTGKRISEQARANMS